MWNRLNILSNNIVQQYCLITWNVWCYLPIEVGVTTFKYWLNLLVECRWQTNHLRYMRRSSRLTAVTADSGLSSITASLTKDSLCALCTQSLYSSRRWLKEWRLNLPMNFYLSFIHELLPFSCHEIHIITTFNLCVSGNFVV